MMQVILSGIGLLTTSLVDYLVGPNGESTNFNAKHLAKCSWCMLLREKVTIDGIVLTKNLIKELIEGN